jgi:hypothetical protein
VLPPGPERAARVIGYHWRNRCDRVSLARDRCYQLIVGHAAPTTERDFPTGKRRHGIAPTMTIHPMNLPRAGRRRSLAAKAAAPELWRLEKAASDRRASVTASLQKVSPNAPPDAMRAAASGTTSSEVAGELASLSQPLRLPAPNREGRALRSGSSFRQGMEEKTGSVRVADGMESLLRAVSELTRRVAEMDEKLTEGVPRTMQSLAQRMDDSEARMLNRMELMMHKQAEEKVTQMWGGARHEPTPTATRDGGLQC